MPETAPYDVRAKPSGGHWIAWVTAPPDTRPVGAVILVGQTQDEATANARRWADRLAADSTLLRE